MKYKIYQWLHKQIAKSRFLVYRAIGLNFHIRAILGCYVDSRQSSVTGNDALVQLRKKVAPAAKVFFDVGANKGRWTDEFLKCSSQTVAGYLYEPLPDLAEKLKEKYKDRNIVINQCALAESPREQVFYRFLKASTHSSLARLPDSTVLTVRISTLDAEAQKNNVSHIDYLKIDAEGFDGVVLEGGGQLLSCQKIGVLQFEFSSAWKEAGRTLKCVINTLESCGYKVFIAARDGLYTFPYALFGENISADFVAVSPKWDWVVENLYKGVL